MSSVGGLGEHLVRSGVYKNVCVLAWGVNT